MKTANMLECRHVWTLAQFPYDLTRMRRVRVCARCGKWDTEKREQN
jgi:hypothetical protein